MTTCKLWAGLGNQLFMMANVIGYAKKWNQPYWFPSHTINPKIWPLYFTNLPGEPEQFFKYAIYKEPSHAYHEIPYFPNVMFEGFFQSEKYFADARKEVIESFNIPYKLNNGFVSIHVRRGDYLLYPDKHPVVTYGYIREAVMGFLNGGHTAFVVCSDDIPWCRQQFKGLEILGARFHYSVNHTAIEDLALLSCSEHMICSNSSFSWWAAYLNQNPDKQIIFPKIWFGPGNAHLNTKDLYPENCIIL